MAGRFRPTGQWNPASHPRDFLGRFSLTAGGAAPSPLNEARALTQRQREAVSGDMSKVKARTFRTSNAMVNGDLKPPSFDAEGAMNNYQYSSDINDKIRAGAPLDQWDTRNRDLLDAQIERAQLKNTTNVYRGVDGHWDNLQPGDQILDRGYLSTSLDPMVAGDFGDVRMEIELPAGTSVMAPGVVDPTLYGEVGELTLGRNSVLEVTERWSDVDPWTKDSVTRMRAKLIGYVDGD